MRGMIALLYIAVLVILKTIFTTMSWAFDLLQAILRITDWILDLIPAFWNLLKLISKETIWLGKRLDLCLNFLDSQKTTLSKKLASTTRFS